MAYGLPMVTTSIGAEGMELSHGINTMIADTTKDFALSVIKLYQSPDLWKKISDASVEHINQRCSLIQAEAKFDDMLFRLFGSNNVYDYIRPDMQRLLMQYNQKSKVIELKKELILHLLRRRENRPVYIWGAGIVGVYSLKSLIELEIDVDGIIDSNPSRQGDIIETKSIFSPEILSSYKGIKPFIVIGTSSKFQKEIEKQLISFGFTAEQDFCVIHALNSRR